MIYCDGMGATTVKLDSDLLKEIARRKSSGQTLSSFVREAVARDLRRRQLKESAEAYLELLATNSAEATAMQEWEEAPLSKPPRRRRK
jgi:Arc/MetJ-type ribon-helix-helix transcriptional regulator